MLNSLKEFFSLRDKNSNNIDKSSNENVSSSQYENAKVSDILFNNRITIESVFANCTDLLIREVKITNNPHFTAMIVYINNMIQSNVVEESVINKLTSNYGQSTFYPGSKEYSQYLLGIRDQDVLTDMSKVIDSVLSGNLALFINGIEEAMIINIANPPSRNIEEPVVETVVRGPREGFTESISTNIALIRKKIKSTNLKIETFKFGRETRTDIAIIYLSNIVNLKIIDELKERLNRIDIDAVLGANFIKEYIEDEPLSSFPTLYSTERPDVITSKLLAGKVAIIVDGTPLAISLPCIFSEFFTTDEDFYIKFIPATINRWIRYISFIFSLILPGLYLAITTFHQELIPTPLLIAFIKSRSGVPYSALIECLLMLLIYEILREAGVRMPRAVGQAISVVGALVLGQAAVEAGIVSAPMVIVISTTALCSFAIPSTDMYVAIVLPRLIFILLGSFLGLLGLNCGLIILFIRLIAIRSFGVPYMGPLAPIIPNELPDMFMRRPIWSKIKRSWLITRKNSNKKNPKSRLESIKEDHKKDNELKNKE